MSVMNENGIKIVLPRSGADEFWTEIHRYYAHDDARKWKHLAMLALRVNAGWSFERIGKALGHRKGHVARSIAQLIEELRARFDVSDDMFEDGHVSGSEARSQNRRESMGSLAGRE